MDDPVEIRAARIAYQTALVHQRTARTELFAKLVGLATAAVGLAAVGIAALGGPIG